MNKPKEKQIAQEGEHYSVWLRQEHYTQFKIPRSVAKSLDEAIQLVRDNDEKIHGDYNVFDCFEDWGYSYGCNDEISEAKVDKD
jgi:hypothetical protein